MKFRIKVRDVGGSLGIILKKDLLQHIDVKKDDIIIIQDDEGKHGNFLSVWKALDEEAEDE